MLSSKVRTGIYSALGVLNIVLLVLTQQSAFPEADAHYIALGTAVIAALMKEFGSKDPEVTK